MKRTFQVALFGANQPAARRMFAALHAARGSGKPARVPDLRGPVVEFFDYEHAAGNLRATFRVHVVTGDDPIEQMAFLSLWGVDAAVYIPSGKTDAAAAKAMTKHFATYGQPLVLVAAAKPVPGIEGLAVPPTGAPLADAIEREIVEAFRAKRIKGRTTTPPTKAYTTRAKQIADAADIALGLGPPKLKLLHESTKAMALHPGLGFATTSSLHTLESALFEYWKGTKGVHVTKFWAQVAERKLPFTR